MNFTVVTSLQLVYSSGNKLSKHRAEQLHNANGFFFLFEFAPLKVHFHQAVWVDLLQLGTKLIFFFVLFIMCS